MDWGRLFESNMRSFLQTKGNVNKGIRKTILEEPRMFLSYNNGLAATAESVELERTEIGLVITRAENLQIVDGDQTTASIHAARRAADEVLKDIYVQMKLSIAPSVLADIVVPRISEFVDSQNKINAADFFANHPFHVRIEELSRKILVPTGVNGYRETKWFYERGRETEAEKNKWDAEFPHSQFFTKTDLAKFENSWLGKPAIASKGAQKNFVDFTISIAKNWGSKGDRTNDVWYRHLISKELMF